MKPTEIEMNQTVRTPARSRWRLALVIGVVRVAEAFAALGDHEVVQQCLQIAERLVADERDLRARVQAFREQWMAARCANSR